MPQEFEYFAILTNKGTEKLAQYLQSGEKLTISWVVVGDGNGSIPMPDPGRTALVHEVWRGPAQVAGDLVNKNVIKATSVIPTDVGGWNVREIGLIDQDGELFAIANAPGYPKISIADGINNDMCAGINIKVDGTVIIATIQDIEECIQRHENNLHAHPHFTEPVPHVSENDRKYWSGFSNTGTVKAEGTDFAITPVLKIATDLFSLTVKMPRTFAEDDTITVDGVAYTLYQGSDPADSEAFKAGEVVTLNFDKTARRCWAGGGGGVPKPLPAQISNLKGVAVEGETPKITWTWTNPVDENFAGMVLVVKEGSSPNGPTDGTQVYKGSSTTVTQTEGLQFERTYYARGFAYNSQGKYQMNAEGATATVELSAVPEQVSDVTLTPNKSHATLSWTNPVSTNLQTVKVIQKIGSDPENPNDGTQVYEGTGTTVTVDNLQDSIDYRFGIFAIGKNGKYKDPVVKNYTPAIYPKYTYTGEHLLVKDENYHWRIKFLTSGTLTWLWEDTEIDIFCVGAGAKGGNWGGGGGRTATYKKQKITRDQEIVVVIGATAFTAGASSFGSFSAKGGGPGAEGGSGGGAPWDIFLGDVDERPVKGGDGGSDGKDGGSGYRTDEGTLAGGKGQGTTTREFGEPDGDLYSGGGGGEASAQSGYTQGGLGGEGTPKLAKDGANYTNPPRSGGKAGGGYGGGGGGAAATGGAGAQGIVIIRNTREVA